MARPTKTLAAHLRDRSFRAHRHEDLLAGPLVGPPELQALQSAWQSATTKRRRELAIAYAAAVRDGNPRSAPAKTARDPATPGTDVAEWFAENLSHAKGPAAGQPFVLEPWQRAFVDEFYRLDAEGRRIYRLGVLGVPRGNGKSPLAAGLGLYELAHRDDSPDIFVAAGGREQARITFNFARAFVEGGPLIERLQVGRNDIVHPASVGSMRVLSAEGSLQHGLQPSAVIIDEVWAFTSAKQVELWTSLETALHKRIDSFLLAITTAGWDRETILGKLYAAALERLELERPHDCLTVGRDEETGVLFWWFGAPDGADADDEDVWRRCNPASWVDLRDLRRHRASPSMPESTFRRLHLNQWTAGESVWIAPDLWAACESAEDIPDGAEVYVGVDASFSGDATAAAWAWRREDGVVEVRARVWSALRETPAHEFCPDGRIDLGAVEEFIADLAQRFSVREVTYDPAFFARSAELLSARGLVVASLDQRSTPMREAWSQFHEAVGSRTIAHAGDEVLNAHVCNAAAVVDTSGYWKVRKLKQSAKIDGLVAAVIAYSRAARAPQTQELMVSWV